MTDKPQCPMCNDTGEIVRKIPPSEESLLKEWTPEASGGKDWETKTIPCPMGCPKKKYTLMDMDTEKVHHIMEGQFVRAVSVEMTLTPTSHVTIFGEDYGFFADWLPEGDGQKTILRLQCYPDSIEYTVWGVRYFDVIDIAQHYARKYGFKY